jgi:endonuclease/exonuclease/phosphatase family metal-dependent hydrolase
MVRLVAVVAALMQCSAVLVSDLLSDNAKVTVWASKSVVPQLAGQVTVATYNLWNYQPPWPLRRDKIVEQIKLLSPDVIGVQEIRATANGENNQLEELVGLLEGYTAVYLKSSSLAPSTEPLDGDVDPWLRRQHEVTEEGIGILTRLEVANTFVFEFDQDKADPNGRAILGLELNTTTGPILFFVTHIRCDRGKFLATNNLTALPTAILMWCNAVR